jgi:hypothetical protein
MALIATTIMIITTTMIMTTAMYTAPIALMVTRNLCAMR